MTKDHSGHASTGHAGTGHANLGHATVTSGGPGYTCPMHAEVKSPEPGRCPICGMTLVPVTGGPAR